MPRHINPYTEDIYEYEQSRMTYLEVKAVADTAEMEGIKKGLELGKEIGKEEGKEIGREEGKEQKEIQAIIGMERIGISIDKIAEALGIEIDKVKAIIDKYKE